MDKYQVKINPKAISELDYIYNYIAIEKSASENARAQINRIKNAILGLDTFPESHQVRTEGRYAGKYRQLLIDNYIVIFRIDELHKIVDLVVTSSELYDEFARINRIDKAIFESEQELLDGAEAVDAKKVFDGLEKKH